MEPVVNIPAPQTSFIGRESEIAEIADLMKSPECRLLTLSGPGGAGKTRLSIEVAQRVKEQFADGVFFVPLVTASSEDDLLAALFDATQYDTGTETIDCVDEFIKSVETKNVLLVLDNFEHLMACASLLSDIVKHAPGVKLLVTSRGALDLQEEWVRRVEGLALPDGDSRPELSAAVQLFLNRAEQVRQLNALDVESVISICRMVEGMPLAIELSAGWVNTLTPADIASEIHKNIDILTSTRRNIDERHRSMRVVFDHSLKLLGEEERDLFQRLTVFCGGFAREAAEAVAGASLSALAVLVNRSLLHLNANGRYSVHELLRQYAWGADATLRDRHMNYYLELVRAAPLQTAEQIGALNLIERETENIRRAWERAVETGALDLISKAAENVGIYCDMRTQYQLGVRLMRVALDQIDPESLLAAQLNLQLIRMIVLGGLDIPMDVPSELEHCMAIINKLGAPADEAFCIYMQAVAAKMRFMVQQVSIEERAESAVYRMMTDAYNRFVALGNRYYEADALTWRGWAELNMGKTEQGMQHMLDSLAIRREMGDRHGAAWVLHTLAHSYYDTLHDFAEAESCLRQAGVILREYNSIKGIVQTDTHLATMMLGAGDFESARRMAEETFDLSHSINHLEGEISALGLMAVLAALFDGHYDVAMAMARQSRAIHERALWVHPFPVVHAGMSFAACGSGNYALMRRSFKEMIFPGRLGDPMIASMVLGMEVVARAHENNPVSAVQLLALAQRLPEVGRRWMDRWELLNQTLAELNQQLGQAAYTDAWNRGAMLDLDAMLRHIADPDAVIDPAGSGAANQALPEPLTEREAEILALLAAGLSNLEIADHLVLSVGTVKVHTRHIYQKLGVGSRTQAIAKAAEIKLL